MLEPPRRRLCHREIPVLCREGDGSLIEGVADLVFCDEPDSPWTVVDFKTDTELGTKQEQYKRQVTIYMQALHQATGAGARGVLIYV